MNPYIGQNIIVRALDILCEISEAVGLICLPMWRTILLIQRYSTVARTVGIPNPNRPLLSGAGYKRNCACWQIASFYFACAAPPTPRTEN